MPGELWTSWNTDPLVWSGLVAMGVAYLWASSRRHDDVARRRRRYFLAALATLLVALVSPLDAMGASLSSAHMVQHLLLTSVAAPLIVLAAPVRTASAALSPEWRLVARAGRRSRPGSARSLPCSPGPCSPACRSSSSCGAGTCPLPTRPRSVTTSSTASSTLTMLATAMLSWAAIILAARRRRHDRPGLAILVLFGLSTASGLLGVLLTFAPDVLYRPYERTAPAWRLSALADQQLAGVIMWVPGGADLPRRRTRHPDRLAHPAARARASTSTNHGDGSAEREPMIDPVLAITLEERERVRRCCRPAASRTGDSSS